MLFVLLLCSTNVLTSTISRCLGSWLADHISLIAGHELNGYYWDLKGNLITYTSHCTPYSSVTFKHIHIYFRHLVWMCIDLLFWVHIFRLLRLARMSGEFHQVCFCLSIVGFVVTYAVFFAHGVPLLHKYLQEERHHISKTCALKSIDD